MQHGQIERECFSEDLWSLHQTYYCAMLKSNKLRADELMFDEEGAPEEPYPAQPMILFAANHGFLARAIAYFTWQQNFF